MPLENSPVMNAAVPGRVHYRLKRVYKQMAESFVIANNYDDYSITVIMAGHGTAYIGDKSYEAECGTAIATAKGSLISFQAAPFQSMHTLRIEFSEEQAVRAAGLVKSWPFEKNAKLSLNRYTLQMAANLERHWSFGSEQSEHGQILEAQALFIAFLSKLHELHGKEKQSIAQPWIEQALLYIKNHYCEPLTRKQLAAISGVSAEHFSREFKKHSGKTFKAYVTELRIRAAQEQLLGSKSDLVEIAMQVGYQDGFYLSRKFKQFVGAAPTIYLKKPKKIASLTYNYSASLLTLGVTPSVGVVSSWIFNHFRGVINKQSVKWHDNVPSCLFESIRPFKPDLIIDYTSTEERSTELRAIAPLISLPFEELPWDEQFRYIADVVDKGTEANDCLNRLQALIEKANEALDREIGKRGSAVVIDLGIATCYVYGDKWGRGTHMLYDSLQFTPPECLLKDGQCTIGYIETSLEEVPAFAADHMFFSLPDDGQERSDVLAFMNKESWRRMAAVQNNHVYFIKGDVFYGFDPASTEKQLMDIMLLMTRRRSN
jgi:ABC-type Fe3+-hydroxamate transport system substrate-binding protein